MPKETFFNLPEDKRALICKVAVEEFAEYSFDKASVNRIVAKAGIAKGSFYQYFNGKKDLFLFLLQLAAKEKFNYFSPLVNNSNHLDVFTLFRELYKSGIQFAADHPEYAAISKKLTENKDSPIFKEVLVENLPTAYQFFETLLENARDKGEIRTDIDLRMLAFMVASMSNLVVEYYTEFVAEDYAEKMIETLDQFLDVLKNGIGIHDYAASQI